MVDRKLARNGVRGGHDANGTQQHDTSANRTYGSFRRIHIDEYGINQALPLHNRQKCGKFIRGSTSTLRGGVRRPGR